MPYDQFVRELIAPSPESEGFIRGIKWRGNVNASQKPELQFAQNVSQVFLGMNMKCAFVPRQLHRSLEARGDVRPGGDLCRMAPLEIYRCDKPTRKMARGGLDVSRAGADRSDSAARASGCSGWRN